MKPLGSITMCFPFVDGETRNLLQAAMDDSSNLQEFVRTLHLKTIEENPGPLFAFFAFFFCLRISEYELCDQLAENGKIPVLAQPLFLMMQTIRGKKVSWEEMKTAVARSLKSAPNDGVALFSYLPWRIYAEEMFQEADTDIRPFETLEASIMGSKDLEVFSSYYYILKSLKFRREGNIKESDEMNMKCIAHARKIDDRVTVVDGLIVRANYLKNTNLREAIEVLQTASKIAGDLGYRDIEGQINHSLSMMHAIRGELNTAIHHQREYMKIKESIGLSPEFSHGLIALFYNLMADGKNALPNALSAINHAENKERRDITQHYAFLTWALINLGRNTEASVEIEKLKKQALQSGIETNILWSNIVEGLFDKSEGNYESSIVQFKEAMKMMADSPFLMFKNICLLNLAEIEVDSFTPEQLKENLDLIGPWMEKLEEYAEKNDLPGIAARALLLKAKLRYRQGCLDEVRRILKEVLKTAEAPSMKYLNDLVISMFPDIILT